MTEGIQKTEFRIQEKRMRKKKRMKSPYIQVWTGNPADASIGFILTTEY